MTILDKIDYEILRILQGNARLSISEIANMLDLSRPTVRNRIKKLINSGIIKRFTVIINDGVIEGIHVIFSFKTSDIDGLISLLKKMDEFVEIYITSGEKNVIGRAIFPNIKEFKEVMDRLIELNISFNASLILKRVKEPYEYNPQLIFRLTCDYCGKEIEAKPYSFTIYNRIFHFCCPTCLRDFRKMREK